MKYSFEIGQRFKYQIHGVVIRGTIVDIKKKKKKVYYGIILDQRRDQKMPTLYYTGVGLVGLSTNKFEIINDKSPEEINLIILKHAEI